MRVFWSIMGLLVVVAAVVMVRGGTTKVDSASPNDGTANNRPTQSPVTAVVPRVGEAPAAGAVDTASIKITKPEVMDSQPATDEAAALADELMAASDRATTPSEPSSQPATAANAGEHAVTPAAPKSYEAKVDPDAMELAKHSKIEPQADGSVLIDNKYTVRGSGSPDDPYQLSWDLLTSASETYQPRLGLTQVPQRVNMLNGKHVRITGYMAFPLAQMEAKEVLIMLNMWDGCCIGIPPSPYDAIEVQLAEALPYDKRRFINYGTLTGVMKVDPYLVNDWLLGLYLVEDAKLDFGL